MPAIAQWGMNVLRHPVFDTPISCFPYCSHSFLSHSEHRSHPGKTQKVPFTGQFWITKALEVTHAPPHVSAESSEVHRQSSGGPQREGTLNSQWRSIQGSSLDCTGSPSSPSTSTLSHCHPIGWLPKVSLLHTNSISGWALPPEDRWSYQGLECTVRCEVHDPWFSALLLETDSAENMHQCKDMHAFIPLWWKRSFCLSLHYVCPGYMVTKADNTAAVFLLQGVKVGSSTHISISGCHHCNRTW